MHPADTSSLDPFTDSPFWIGPVAVEPALNQICPNGSVYKVEPRVMRVLLCLAARPGAVLTREALLDAVWTDALPNDEGLTQAVCKLRKAFGDRARRSTVIETIPKVGYRLVAPVSARPPSCNGPERPPTPEDGQAPPRAAARPATVGLGDRHAEWRWLAVCFALLILFCGLWSSYVARRPAPVEQRRILIHKIGPDATAPTRHRVRIMAWRTEAPFDVHQAPMDQEEN